MPKNTNKKIPIFTLLLFFILPFCNFTDKLANNQPIKPISLLQDLPVLAKSSQSSQSSQNLSISVSSSQSSQSSQISQSSQNPKRIDEIGVFVSNENKTDLIEKTRKYITKYQKGESPLDPEMIVNTAQKNDFPLDLILIQAHTESHFCTNGRAKDTKNCWNIGNFDTGDTKATDCQDGSSLCLDNFEKGLDLYINYMKSCHFHEGEKISTQKFFDRDFRIVRQGSKICGGVGKRYATDSNYRQNLAAILQNNFNSIFSK